MPELYFLRPAWLAAIPLVMVCAMAIWRRGKRAGDWRTVCDPHLLNHLLHDRSARGHIQVALLTVAVGVLAVVALAGPAWDKLQQPMMRTLYGRVVVLDLSRSMDATDVAPTRLTLARRKVTDLLARSSDLQTGLVVFAGDAFAITPLTDDHRTLAGILPVLDTGVMPRQGSRVDLGLAEALQLLQAGGVSDGEVIVVGDGLKGDRAIDAAAELYAAGFRVSVLAVGTTAGGVIPLADGGLLRGLDGSIVKPRLTLPALRALTRAGGGLLVRAAGDGSDLAQLTANTATWQRSADMSETRRTAARWRDQGPWLVLALLPLSALAFRRGWLLMLPLTVVLTAHGPPSAHAAPDPAMAAPTRDCPDDATVSAGDASARAIRSFRDGDYLQAAAWFACGDTADAHYNRGTSLARAWRFVAALAAFDEALTRDPAHADALHNRAVVRELLLRRRAPAPEANNARARTETGTAREAADARSNEFDTTDRTPAASSADTGTYAGSGADGSTLPPTVTGAPQGRSVIPVEQASSGDVPEAAMSPDARRALEAALARIPDDPAGLWRQKLALKHWRRQRTPPRRSDAW